ncbi:MAG: 2-polyprenylphenol 6-hydroxylase [Rhodospirillales bacterium]
MLRPLLNIVRLLRLARTLARHDALFLLERLEVAEVVVIAARLLSRRREEGRPGQRLARALNEAGPSFIKLGQALSTRSDLLGEEMAGDLSELQDRLPPFGGLEARAAIKEEFGAECEALFSRFDDKPIAAASIAQVHFAVTADGREVAVKVLRPGVEEAFARDIDLFMWLAELIEARPQWRRLKPVESIKTLAESVAMEMDLRFEASAAEELAENFSGDETFNVPKVDWARTGRRVLTTQRVTGLPLDDRQAIVGAGHDPLEVLAKASGAFFKQVFRDGFFHADLHAGNLFVDDDGNIAAVDFGIMGRIDKPTRFMLAEMLLAFLNRDYRRAAEIHFEAGLVPRHRSVDSFTQACRSIGEPIMDKPQNEISFARLLGQLFQITETFEMEAQPQLLLLQKTMLVSEGTGRRLAPEANMWLLARPLIEDWVGENLGPDARLRDGAIEMASFMKRLPKTLENLEKGAAMLAEGGVRLHPGTIRDLQASSARRVSMPSWLAAVLALALIVALIL